MNDLTPWLQRPNAIDVMESQQRLVVMAEYPVGSDYGRLYGRCFVYAKTKTGHIIGASLFTLDKLIELIERTGATPRLYYEANPLNPDELFPAMELNRNAR